MVRTNYLEDFRVSKYFVSESVEPLERDSDGSGGDEVLEIRRMLEVVGGRSAFESAEGDVGAGQWRNVAELVRAQSLKGGRKRS